MKKFKEFLMERKESYGDIFFREVFGKVFDWAMVDFYGQPLIEVKGFYKLIYDPEYQGSARSDTRILIMFNKKAKEEKVETLKQKIQSNKYVAEFIDASGLSGYQGWQLDKNTRNFVVYLKPTPYYV